MIGSVKQPLHELAGGREGLRALLEDFYDRVFGDLLIGFLFEGRDKARLVEMELELTLGLLGADVRYTGKPIREAHAPFPIMGGHFERRAQLLRETMAAHGLHRDAREAWLAHGEAMRSLVTSDKGSDCDPTEAARRGRDDGS